MKELIEMFESFVYKNGLEPGRVFDDLLRYIIQGFSLPGQPGLKDWHYTKEQNKEFHEMFVLCVKTMEKELRTKEWFDIFGKIYSKVYSTKEAAQAALDYLLFEINEVYNKLVKVYI